jgi:hypothetical protein
MIEYVVRLALVVEPQAVDLRRDGRVVGRAVVEDELERGDLPDRQGPPGGIPVDGLGAERPAPRERGC